MEIKLIHVNYVKRDRERYQKSLKFWRHHGETEGAFPASAAVMSISFRELYKKDYPEKYQSPILD